MITIAGFGNPLLDITINIDNERLLKKHNLKMEDQSQISEKQMSALLDDIKDLPSTRTLGGCVQNTLRILQWLTPGQNYCTYMIGAIGNDKEGELIKKLIKQDGVTTLYSLSEKKRTGVTVALVENVKRSLVAYVGAAETFTINDFHQVTENGKRIENADLIYVEGFFLTERHDVTKYIVEFTLTKEKLFMYNLSAPYICMENFELVKYIVNNCDILVGNILEYEALANLYEPGCTSINLALHLNKLGTGKSVSKYGKMILITDAPNPVVCVYGHGQKSIIPVYDLPNQKIKDTTGAGDAFAAGFIAGLFKDYSPEKCARYGSWTAAQIIQQIGCATPDNSPDFK